MQPLLPGYKSTHHTLAHVHARLADHFARVRTSLSVDPLTRIVDDMLDFCGDEERPAQILYRLAEHVVRSSSPQEQRLALERIMARTADLVLHVPPPPPSPSRERSAFNCAPSAHTMTVHIFAPTRAAPRRLGVFAPRAKPARHDADMLDNVAMQRPMRGSDNSERTSEGHRVAVTPVQSPADAQARRKRYAREKIESTRQFGRGLHKRKKRK
jgi:hypothetical protein